ncbi:hypothetical protein N7457_004187 [Penicillium paradoxum]|uniref:uncharacterized protein n=1 Tax=Penicillium paradoxum TaxID=176176 RepID=UPI002547B0F1|nr:uncharacterized protein N7457_004187 [Penicillium paradoxum]KAJ5782413.1 hypothetical protein N7457_004187 [Penicillium paradoxum]
MRRFRTVFRSKSDTPNLASSRSIWPRRHRSSEGDPVKPQAGATSQEVTDDEQRPATSESGGTRVKPTSSAAVASPDNNAGKGESNAQPAEETVDLSRSKNGTKRLKKMVARFRGSSSQDDEPIAEPQGQTEQRDTRKGRPTAKPLSSNPFEPEAATGSNTAGKSVRFNDPKERRKTSGQTTHSQDSSQTEDTVCRDSSQHISMPIPEPWDEWGWPGLMLYGPEERRRVPEGSDPFSDGKATDIQSTRPGSSRHSAGTSRDESRTSEGTLEPIPEIDVDAIEPVIEPIQSQTSNDQKTDSTSSQKSRVSWSSTLDAPKAIMAFNRMAVQFGIQISIPVEDAAVSPPASSPAPEEEDTSRRGFKFLGKVRKVRSSNLATDTAPLAPTPKLRRIKTFANLHRPGSSAMTSLQGRSVETLARLGGHGYLMLVDLAPCPVQLPACIVATLMFLHKYGLNTPDLFLQPGDLRAAVRMYDHFADQVLTAEKDEAKIAFTMRVVAMPTLSEDAAPVLSVAWALKALLAGLPNGILGSVRLYQIFRAMYFHSIPNQSHLLRVPDCISEASPTTAARVQLICLALIALATEMQRDLICAVFGLLSLLVHESEGQVEGQVQGQESGMELREPLSNPNFHDLARAFGPLLLGSRGQENQDGTGKVEQEINDQRVAGLLLNNWHFVHRQLRHWTSGRYVLSKE